MKTVGRCGAGWQPAADCQSAWPRVSEVRTVDRNDGRQKATVCPTSVLRRAVGLLWALLRELSDESAYQRHLRVHGRNHSGAEWRRFSEERLRARYAQGKCC